MVGCHASLKGAWLKHAEHAAGSITLVIEAYGVYELLIVEHLSGAREQDADQP